MTSTPAVGQRVDPRARRVGAGDHDHRRLGDGGDDPALERQPGARVEDHPGGLAGRGHPARGQQGVVVDRGVDADRDRIEVGAPAMDQLPGRFAGDPPRLPRGGRGAPVEGERGLENDQRATGPGVLAEGLVEPPWRRSRRRPPTRRPRPRRREGSPGRGRSPSGSDRRSRSRPAPIPAARIASAQGGWRPWCAQGSSVTYIVAPARSAPRSRASSIAATSAWRSPRRA